MVLKTLFASIILAQTLSAHAFSSTNLPNSFAVKQTKCPAEGKHCMVLMANGKTIGFFEPAQDKTNLFYFYDERHQKQVSIKYLNTRTNIRNCGMNCPIFQDFDLYEKNNHLVAKLELSYDVMQSSFHTLRLYTKDHRNLLISGMHTTSSGTMSLIFDGLNPGDKLALITRPLFTRSLNSEISILDKSSLLFSVDSNMFATTLALYCNTSLFYENPEASSEQTISPESLQNLRKKLQNLAESQGVLLDIHTYLNDHAIKAVGNILIQRYQQTYGDFWDDESIFTKDKKLQQMFDLGSDLILSHSLNPTEEKALFQFLTSQLYLNQP